MAIGLIARVTLQPGKGEEFERVFAAQAEAVRGSEPGNLLYRLFRSREQPESYVVMEIYQDEAALAAHRASPHLAANRPVMAGLVAQPTVIELYDAV